MNTHEQNHLKTISNVLLVIGVMQVAADFPFRTYIALILGIAFAAGQAIAHLCAEPTVEVAVASGTDLANAVIAGIKTFKETPIAVAPAPVVIDPAQTAVEIEAVVAEAIKNYKAQLSSATTPASVIVAASPPPATTTEKTPTV